MRWQRWFPWKFIIRKLAVSQGFLDPVLLLARLSRFGQPSEVAAPAELLRAASVLHARGLINSQVIQYNLDWVWPYWIVRQFDPKDHSFIPRAFSLTHINLTHRNWTAVGLPDLAEFPIVDPRGLLTPVYDGWSLDGWIIREGQSPLIPARSRECVQKLRMKEGLSIWTSTESKELRLEVAVQMISKEKSAACQMKLKGSAKTGAQLVVSLRPYNPEGVSFVHQIKLIQDAPGCPGWEINGKEKVFFEEKPDSMRFSRFQIGDVYRRLEEPEAEEAVMDCPVGMATAAALFKIPAGQTREVTVHIPFAKTAEPGRWDSAISGTCSLQIPNPRWQFLYDAAVRSLVLHAPGDIYPGPYTYKRFWFRDAAFIMHALLCLGLGKRAEKVIDLFPKRQTPAGYFLSQEGEWDSNGEALWAMERFCAIMGHPPKLKWKEMIFRAAGWIRRKRLPAAPPTPHAGLFPAGYSAEHLGPSDYYYWDDFWGAAGLQAASELVRGYGDLRLAQDLLNDGNGFLQCIDRSLSTVTQRFKTIAMPASPYRRLDPGAIGSIAGGYPLKVLGPDDPRLRATVEYLLKHCFFRGGFFQDMSHSGINPYLTLDVAQVLLRQADPRCAELIQSVADLASPTGQWPEAVHPWTKGGCMGDGQHIWAAAEWILMLRNCFVREEAGRLILGSGLLPEWLIQEKPLFFGPAPTEFGVISVTIKPHRDGPIVSWTAQWHRPPPFLEIRIPGFHPITEDAAEGTVRLKPVEGPAL
ncbi:MAG: hypothetical protein HY594_03135 [Candidatus Omnitrophica bacterium]|nr:hypothetical protein [Candidatus Omnitrophota bacterium]